MRMKERAYRVLLRLYPRAFRERFGDDMLDLFRDRHRRIRGAGPTLVFWAHTIADSISQAIGERRSAERPRAALAAGLGHDVRYACRLFLRRPVFSLAATLTLALGLGANIAIFSVTQAVLLRPLPYPDPSQLVKLRGTSPRMSRPSNLSLPDVRDFARDARSFEELGAHGSVGTMTLTGTGEPERVAALGVSSAYFRVLRARPALGRLFLAEEDRPSPPDVVVISDGLWRRRFGADPAVVGRVIQLNAGGATVIGVLPPDFAHPELNPTGPPDVWSLLDPDERMSSRSGRYVRAIGRLQSGVTIGQARAELASIAERLEREHPIDNLGAGVFVAPLKDDLVGDLRTALTVLLVAVAFVLLIACANLANLLIALGASREKELAIRAALGAGRRRLVRQLLVESALLGLAGGAGGLFVAWLAVDVLPVVGPALPAGYWKVGIDGPVLAFALALSLVTGLVFGLAPAFQASRSDSQALREGPRGSSATGLRAAARRGLIAAEVALSLILLVGAGLLLRSFARLVRVDPGFSRPAQVLTLQLALPLARYPEGTQIPFYDRLYARVAALPGVEHVGGVNILPLSGGYSCDAVQIEDHPVPEAQRPCAEARSASPGYFSAMGIPHIRGRVFEHRDTVDSPSVAVISETMARRFWPGEDPIGRRFTYRRGAPDDRASREVIGIVADVKHLSLADEAPPEFYTPQTQIPSYHAMTLTIRTAADPAAIGPAVRSSLSEMDAQVPIYNMRTLDRVLSVSVAASQFRTLLLGAFAGVALLLALVGIYGVVAHAVSERTQEIGVRMALGAHGLDVLRMMLGQGLRPIGAGLLAGLAGAAALSRLMTSLLYDVSPTDPLTIGGVAALLFCTALLAAYIPARRASRIDPIVALRSE